ncbi:16S rRNA (guanine(966)-N(2))-methyltransferase RsmD [Candidatus Bipolaricaulota bacterium]|nr:16S rRNA (guanine(966)-N(2))-methyltransferase RsmD [Candidatus Bipolaricaulota bacterium]
MRIIGGSHRGRKLVPWEETGIRPMRDFVRSALFSILVDFVTDAEFLDLYGGTGSVGLEALSRGARHAVFVDRSKAACAIVRRNLDALGFLDAAEVIEGDSNWVVRDLGHRGRRFDVVFVGPPYYHELVPATLEALADGRILAEDSIVVAEIHKNETAAPRYGVLARVDDRRYGDNRLLFYRVAEMDDSDERTGPRE